MPGHIPKSLKKLVVISDTAMCSDASGNYAFGPVVKELENFTFTKRITWIGFKKERNNAFVSIANKHLKLVPLKHTGGRTLLSKLSILIQYPIYFFRILKQVFKADIVHVRAPSNPAVIAYVLSWFFIKKQFWFKYAGNWQGHASWFYRVQRYMLTMVSKNVKVTINGNWPDQKKHIYSFENPCLTDSDKKQGEGYVKDKTLAKPCTICFIGNLDENKGIKLLLKALKLYNKEHIKTLHIVGGGKLEQWVKAECKAMNFNVVLHGFLPKDAITSVYKISHFIILPSKSEGFPKVIGEAMNYGCVPIISNISCISQYITHSKNGYLIDAITVSGIAEVMQEVLKIDERHFCEMLEYNYTLAGKFTYSYYEQQVLHKIFEL